MNRELSWSMGHKRLVALLVLLMAIAGALVAPKAAHAVPAGTCGRRNYQVAGANEFWDNGSFVMEADRFDNLPATLSGCHNLWIHTDECVYTRIVRITPQPYWYEAWNWTCGSGYRQGPGFPSGALNSYYTVTLQACEIVCPNNSTSSGFSWGWIVD